MHFPLTFWDISLWLGITAMILLVTSEIISPYYGYTKMVINRRKLRNVAFTTGTLFLITVMIRIIGILMTP